MTSSVPVWTLNSTVDNDLPFYCQYCRCTIDNTVGFRSECFKLGLFRPPRNLSPNTTELYLRKNRIPAVSYDHLKNLTKLRVLDLSANVIGTIDVGAFQDLNSLEALYLHENKFYSYDKVLQPGVFSGLTKLKLLTLHGCLDWVTAVHTKLPGTPFTDLVHLETLTLDGVKNVRFGEEFKNLKYLTTLTMSGVRGACAIFNLGRFSFVGVPNITNLELDDCDIESIETDTFYTLVHLTYLDLSKNDKLGFNGLGNIYLQSTNITVLKANTIHAPYRAGSEILRQNMRNIRDTSTLVEIYLESNGLEFIDYGVFDLIPKSVKYLSMKDNRLSFGLNMYEAIFNTNLEVFDAGNQYPGVKTDRSYINVPGRYVQTGRRKRESESHKRWVNRHDHSTSTNIETIIELRSSSSKTPEYLTLDDKKDIELDSPPQRLREALSVYTPKYDSATVRDKRSTSVKARTTIRKLSCSGSMTGFKLIDFNNTENNISFMDISENFIRYITANSFWGLEKLRLLNLSRNYIEYLDADAFRGLHSLETLDMQNNLLGFRLGFHDDGLLFSHLPNVIYLNLSMNRISTMDKYVFSKMVKIRNIDLSINYLQDFNVDVERLKHLRFVNLSYNGIKHLSSDSRHSLESLGRNRDFAIDLSANNFMCNCDTLPFLRWLLSAPIHFVNKHQYFCTLNNDTVRYFNSSHELLLSLEEECVSYIGVIISCSISGSFVASLCLFFVLYRQRWRLLYLYYMAKAKLDVGKDMAEKDLRFQNDIFVSYADGDRMFVIKEMLENLETNAGLTLNIRDRDFDVGEMIAVNISRAVRTSKRTFLMFSRHFLKNRWCNFEMNMARMEAIHMKRKVIVIVFLDQVPHHLLPLEILDLLRECPSIEYPNNDFERRAFWEKCKELVNM